MGGGGVGGGGGGGVGGYLQMVATLPRYVCPNAKDMFQLKVCGMGENISLKK